MAHDHEHSELSETEVRVRALETVLLEKSYMDPAALYRKLSLQRLWRSTRHFGSWQRRKNSRRY
jgi:hypothetical protein